MNCHETSRSLPEHLYGDLPAGDAAAVEQHLGVCPACRGEWEALQSTRQMLNTLSTPRVPIDLRAIYANANRLQLRRLRRWCYVAAGLGIAASFLIAALLLKIEVRVDAQPVLVRWGARSEGTAQHSTSPISENAGPAPVKEADDVALLKELVRAVVVEIEWRERRQQQELTLVHRRLEGLQRQLQQVRVAAERDMAALYAVQLNNAKKGGE
jgi:hypothetical protein